MALFIPPGYGHVIHSLSLVGDSEPMAVTIGILNDIDSFETDAGAQAACDQMHAAFGSEIMDLVPNVYTHTQTELFYRRESETSSDPTHVAVSSGSTVGGASGAPLPQNCALLVHKRTSVAGRRGRGRCYIPGPEEGQVSAAGVVLNVVVADWQDHLDAWLAAIVASANIATAVVLHSTTLTIPDPDDLPSPYTITNLVMDSTIATQRRRLRK